MNRDAFRSDNKESGAIALIEVVVLLVGERLISDDVVDVPALFLLATSLLVPVVVALDAELADFICHDVGFAICVCGKVLTDREQQNVWLNMKKYSFTRHDSSEHVQT